MKTKAQINEMISTIEEQIKEGHLGNECVKRFMEEDVKMLKWVLDDD